MRPQSLATYFGSSLYARPLDCLFLERAVCIRTLTTGITARRTHFSVRVAPHSHGTVDQNIHHGMRSRCSFPAHDRVFLYSCAIKSSPEKSFSRNALRSTARLITFIHLWEISSGGGGHKFRRNSVIRCVISSNNGYKKHYAFILVSIAAVPRYSTLLSSPSAGPRNDLEVVLHRPLGVIRFPAVRISTGTTLIRGVP